MFITRMRSLALPALVLVALALLAPGAKAAQSHTVTPGDTLFGISRGWFVDLQALIYTNGLKNDQINAGQQLYIPGSATQPNYGELQRRLEEWAKSKSGVTYGIFFEDLATGKTAGVNADTWIPAASTIKTPTVLYLNELASQGKIDWQTKISYKADVDWQDGAGLLQFAARDGETYSLRVLSNLAITVSDNIAYRMLRRHLGLENIIGYMRGLGGRTVWPDGNNITTARDMGTYMVAVMNFARRSPELGRRLLDDMANPIYDVGLPGKLPDHVTVAHKEGDVSGVQNDVGIVFGSRPYVLTVLSKGINDVDRGFANISEVSRIVYDYQELVARGL